MPDKGGSANKIDWRQLQEMELLRPPHFPFPPIYDPVPWWIFKEEFMKEYFLAQVQFKSEILKVQLEHNERMGRILKGAKF